MRVAYASETAAHAVLEVLVHLQSSAVLGSYHLVSVRFPSGLVNALDVAELPPTWAESPPPAAVRAIGDEWVRGGSSAVLRVPSVIVEGDHNYLLNPAHPEFAAVNVQPPRPYLFDPRLLGRQR